MGAFRYKWTTRVIGEAMNMHQTNASGSDNDMTMKYDVFGGPVFRPFPSAALVASSLH
jgi:hypothetical protein